MKINRLLPLTGVALALVSLQAKAINFEGDDYSGSFTSTIGVGVGVRTKSPDSDLVQSGATGSGAPAGSLAVGAMNDQGDLNYRKGDVFSQTIKGTHELVLKYPSLDLTFMARGVWISDGATNTSGITSGDGSIGMPTEAKDELQFKSRMLDLWVAKGFQLNGEPARVKVGKQVINWGESLFFAGGINGTNPVDYQALSTPGTQVKETLLAQPTIDLTVGLGKGVAVEAYVQTGYQANYFPPVGSYWSTSYTLGKGASSVYGLTETNARQEGQWGLALRWQPEATPMNLAAYVANYHDKNPQLTINSDYSMVWEHPEDRKMYGISMNMPVGEWAMSGELSYRPKDAVSLHTGVFDATSGVYLCTQNNNGKCWVESERYQFAVNGVYTMNPSNSKPVLDFFKADGGNVMFEYTGIYYPGLQESYNGIPVASGYAAWGMEGDLSDPTLATSQGTKLSGAIGVDLSVNYDGSLIPGWLITPEIYYQHALNGRTPNVTAQFMQGTSALSLIVSFMRSSGGWNASVNYSKFMGGSTYDNVVRDRDFVGLSANYTF